MVNKLWDDRESCHIEDAKTKLFKSCKIKHQLKTLRDNIHESSPQIGINITFPRLVKLTNASTKRVPLKSWHARRDLLIAGRTRIVVVVCRCGVALIVIRPACSCCGCRSSCCRRSRFSDTTEAACGNWRAKRTFLDNLWQAWWTFCAAEMCLEQ